MNNLAQCDAIIYCYILSINTATLKDNDYDYLDEFPKHAFLHATSYAMHTSIAYIVGCKYYACKYKYL